MSNIKLFESKQIRSVWNEKDQKWYFSVQDVVEVLSGSNDVKQYIKKMLSRDDMLKANWGTICTLVEMEAADTPGPHERPGIDSLHAWGSINNCHCKNKKSERFCTK